MNIKNILSNMLLGLMLSLNMNATEGKCIDDATFINQRLDEIKNSNKQAALLLGAVPTEKEHFLTDLKTLNDDPGLFFLNGKHYHENALASEIISEEAFNWSDQLIVADFNNSDHRAAIDLVFSDVFDLIVPDHNVTYFMHLGKPFIADFVSMLKIGGKLILKDVKNFHLVEMNNIVLTLLPGASHYPERYIYETKFHPFLMYNIEYYLLLSDILNGEMYNSSDENILYGSICLRADFSDNEKQEIIQTILNTNYEDYVSKWISIHIPNCSVKFVTNGNTYGAKDYIEIMRTS